MRFLVITPHFAPDTAPTGTIVTELVKHWCGKGHQVHVITSLPWYQNHAVENEWKKKFFSKDLVENLEIIRFYPFPNNKSNFLLRALGFLAFSLVTLIASLFTKGPFDAVFTLSPPITLATAGKFAATRHQCPLVLNVQDIFPDAAIETGVLQSKSLIKFLKVFEKISYKSADLLTVLSKGMEENVKLKLSNEKKLPILKVIPNFAFTNFFNAEKENSYKKENGLEGKLVIMYAGNLGHSQPLELLLNATKVHADNKNLLYVVNGGGVQQEFVRGEAEKADNLVFVEYQPFERLPEVLSAADIHLVMLKPGLGNVSVPSKIYNIFASGRPVVASVDSGTEIERLVLEAEAGFVVPPDKPEAFYEAIEKLSVNPVLRNEMGNSAQLWAKKWHSAQTVSNMYIEGIKDLKTNDKESLP